MNLSGNIVRKKTKKGHAWQITVEMPRDPITGKRNRKYKTISGTKKEAEQELRRFINELEHGEYIADNNITVSAWIYSPSFPSILSNFSIISVLIFKNS